jgi:hypothetical protein
MQLVNRKRLSYIVEYVDEYQNTHAEVNLPQTDGKVEEDAPL